MVLYSVLFNTHFEASNHGILAVCWCILPSMLISNISLQHLIVIKALLSKPLTKACFRQCDVFWLCQISPTWYRFSNERPMIKENDRLLCLCYQYGLKHSSQFWACGHRDIYFSYMFCLCFNIATTMSIFPCGFVHSGSSTPY